eukprot:RCo038522
MLRSSNGLADLLARIGASAPGHIGHPLDEGVRQNHCFVPLLLQLCCEAVESALDTEYLYKAPVPAPAKQPGVGAQGQRGSPPPADVTEVCGVLKAYLTRLPMPVVVPGLCAGFVAVNAVRDSEERVRRVAQLVAALPPANRMVLQYLLRHLYQVAQHSRKNKMTVGALAAVFAPLLFRPPSVADHPALA